MTSFLEAAYGIPADVQTAVNTDLQTATRSLEALDRAIEAAPHDALLARYRALCVLEAHQRLTRTHTAGARSAAAAAGEERQATHRGGGQ